MGSGHACSNGEVSRRTSRLFTPAAILIGIALGAAPAAAAVRGGGPSVTPTIDPAPALQVVSPRLFDAPYVGIPDLTGAAALAVGRVDGDTHLDVVVASAAVPLVSVYRGHGDGTFEAPLRIAVNYRATELLLRDMDHDGDLDIVGMSSFFPSVFVLMGNGDGTFGPTVENLLNGVVAVGDVTGDGLPDLIRGPGSIEVLPGAGNGTFGAPITSGGAALPQKIALADLNGDGLTDLAFTDFFPSTVRTALNHGDGTFADAQTWATSSSFATTYHGIAIGDMNLDGVQDLVTADYYGSTVSVLLGGPGATFGAPASFAATYGANQVELADVDHDGRLDALTSNDFFREVVVLKGRSGGALDGPLQTQLLRASSFAIGDVDEDGEIDLIQPANGGFNVGFGHHDGSFGSATQVTGAGDAGLAAGDGNGDGKADLYSIANSAVLLQIRTGPITFAAPISQSVPFYPDRLDVADLDRDGIDDVVLSSSFSAGFSVVRGTAAPGLNPPVNYDAGSVVMQALVDIDGDGDLDVLGNAGGIESLQRNRGDGSFESPVGLGMAVGSCAAVMDLDGDGRNDLLIGSVYAFTLSVFYALAGGGYTPGPVYHLDHSGASIVTGDFDADGRRDVVVGGFGSFGGVSFLHGRDDGGFDSPVAYQVGAYASRLAAADFDRDGVLDLVCAGEPLTVMRGGAGGLGPRQYYGGGRFFGVADFDDDGRLDIATIAPFSFGTTCWILRNATAPRNVAPDVSHAAASPDFVTSPNHGLIPVTILGVTDPDGDAVSLRVTGVTADEAVNSTGDGATCPDAVIGSEGVRVRGERSGTGNGRVYAISFVGEDGRGGESAGVVRVCVPHDAASPCVDDGQLFDATAGCDPRGRVYSEVAAVAAVREFAVRVVAASRGRLALEVDLPQTTQVQLDVFDVTGARVAPTLTATRPQGTHQFAWTTAFRRGIYFVRVRGEAGVRTRKVAVVD